MKRHPSFEQLSTVAVGTAQAHSNSLSAHVDDCPACRETVDWFERVRRTAVATTALPAPAMAWDSIAERIRAQERVLLPVNAMPAVLRDTDRRSFRVAVAALLITSVVAAAVPTSPVRRWLREVVNRPGATVAPIPPVQTTPGAPQPATVLIVQPLDQTVTIVLEQPAAGVRLRVRLVDGGAVEVRASAGATNAQFRSANGRLTVSNAQAGELTLTIPRTLERVRIEVDGSVYLSKEHGQMRIFAPVADTVGSEIVLPITRGRLEVR